jgi:hypothetical protein
MVLDRPTGVAAGIDGGAAIRSAVAPAQMMGLACVLVGLSQLPLSFLLADLVGSSLPLFVIGGGGWLLIAIGVNMLRGRSPSEVEWTDSARAEWFLAVFDVLLSLFVVAASLYTVLG